MERDGWPSPVGLAALGLMRRGLRLLLGVVEPHDRAHRPPPRERHDRRVDRRFGQAGDRPPRLLPEPHPRPGPGRRGPGHLRQGPGPRHPLHPDLLGRARPRTRPCCPDPSTSPSRARARPCRPTPRPTGPSPSSPAPRRAGPAWSPRPPSPAPPSSRAPPWRSPQLANTQDVALRYWLKTQGYTDHHLRRRGRARRSPPRPATAPS